MLCNALKNHMLEDSFEHLVFFKKFQGRKIIKEFWYYVPVVYAYGFVEKEVTEILFVYTLKNLDTYQTIKKSLHILNLRSMRTLRRKSLSKVKTLEITDLWFKSSFSLPNYQKKKKNMKIPPNLIGEITERKSTRLNTSHNTI